MFFFFLVWECGHEEWKTRVFLGLSTFVVGVSEMFEAFHSVLTVR